jgi:hypothetical protein
MHHPQSPLLLCIGKGEACLMLMKSVSNIAFH